VGNKTGSDFDNGWTDASVKTAKEKGPNDALIHFKFPVLKIFTLNANDEERQNICRVHLYLY